MNKAIVSLFLLTLPLPALAQTARWQVVKVHKQKAFPKTVAAGNYSGLTPLGDNLYAVVDDKAAEDGFCIMRIDVNSVKGDIQHVSLERTVKNNLPSRDAEGITALDSLLYITGEADNQILAYRPDGSRTGFSLPLPSSLQNISHRYGLESLTYDRQHQCFITAPESTLQQDGRQASAENGIANHIRLTGINKQGDIRFELHYQMDKPLSHKAASNYAMGVSELLSLPDGRLLILEREAHVPKRKIGAWVVCKLYIVDIDQALLSQGSAFVEKHLLTQWKTRINLTSRSWANYEGMCLGPTLADGSQTILLVSDSQNQYGKVLRDWWRSIVIKPV